MRGIVSYGVYIPYWRLQRSAIAASLGSGGGRGTRSRGVVRRGHHVDGRRGGPDRPARGARRGRTSACWPSPRPSPPTSTRPTPRRSMPRSGCPPRCRAFDAVGAVRSGVGALLDGASRRRRWRSCPTSAPGSPVAATSSTAATRRWRSCSAKATTCSPSRSVGPVRPASSSTAGASPASPARASGRSASASSRTCPLADVAITDALKSAGLTGADLDHVVIGRPTRAGRQGRVAKAVGARPEAYADDLSTVIGNPASPRPVCCSPTSSTAPSRARSSPSCSCRRRRRLAPAHDRGPRPPAAGGHGAPSASRPPVTTSPTRPSSRGGAFLTREPPRRPDPIGPAPPPSLRSAAWKYGFVRLALPRAASLHLPPSAGVRGLPARSTRWTLERLADVPATIATYTVDRLAVLA